MDLTLGFSVPISHRTCLSSREKQHHQYPYHISQVSSEECSSSSDWKRQSLWEDPSSTSSVKTKYRREWCHACWDMPSADHQRRTTRLCVWGRCLAVPRTRKISYAQPKWLASRWSRCTQLEWTAEASRPKLSCRITGSSDVGQPPRKAGALLEGSTKKSRLIVTSARSGIDHDPKITLPNVGLGDYSFGSQLVW